MEIQNAYNKNAAQLKSGCQIDLMEAKIANVSADVEVKRANELNELREKLTWHQKK